MGYATTPASSGWERQFSSYLPVFGHRNWIVIADAAYPSQSNPAIRTIQANADQIDVAREVLAAIAASRHVRANVYLDQELDYVAEQDAPGITEYRRQLSALPQSSNVRKLMHENIIAKLDQAARMFDVLIIKTNMVIPYTSIFLELDCGYWTAEAEERLRRAVESGSQPTYR